MVLTFNPIFPWHVIVSVAAGLFMIAVAVNGVTRRWRALSSRPGLRLAIIAVDGLATAALVGAVWNPLLVGQPPLVPLHVSIAFDVSDSVLRVEGGFGKVRSSVSAFL